MIVKLANPPYAIEFPMKPARLFVNSNDNALCQQNVPRVNVEFIKHTQSAERELAFIP